MGELGEPVRSVRLRGGSGSAGRLAIGLLAGFLIGIALTIQVRNFWALGVEAGGSCGSGGRSGISHGPCPRNWGLLFVLTFLPLFVLVPLAWWAALKPRKIGCLAALAALLVGIPPGMAIFEWAHGASLETVWSAPQDRPASVEGMGSWLHGPVVVRARFDGLNAYDLGSGGKRWSYSIPAPAVLCAMSRGTEGGVGLIGYSDEGKPCVRVAAIDLDSGRALWEKVLPSDSIVGHVTPDVMAVARDTAVAQAPQSIQGFSLREGAVRWQAKAAERCRFDNVAAGADQVITEVACVGSAPKIRLLDAGTGRTRWESPAPIRGTSANITLLSASPAVVHVQEGGQRGVNVLVAYDEGGRVRTTIETDDGERRLDVNSLSGFDAAPVRKVFVRGDRLVAVAQKDKGRTFVQAYGLADGRLAWSVRVRDIEGLQVEADRVLVLSDGPRNPDLHSISLRDGRKTYLGVTPFRWLTSSFALYSSGGRYVLVTERATTADTFPVAVIKKG